MMMMMMMIIMKLPIFSARGALKKERILNNKHQTPNYCELKNERKF
jgi:hypothetical protein